MTVRFLPAFTALALLGLAVPAHADPTPAQAARLAALKAEADRVDGNADPRAYRAAYERAVAYARTVYPADHPAIEKLRMGIMVARFGQGDTEGLVEEIEHAITVFERAGPTWQEDLVDSLNNLATVVEARGDAQRAMGLLERVVAIRRTMTGPLAEAYLGLVIGNLSWACRGQGDYARALPLALEGVALLEKSHRENPGNRDVADTLAGALGNLPVYYADLGRHAEASEAVRALVARLDELTGPASTAGANAMLSGSIFLVREGKQAEAEALVRRAIASYTAGVGAESGQTARANLRLVTILMAQGRHAEAQPLAEQAATVLAKTLGPLARDTIEARVRLARIAFALEDKPTAIARMRALLVDVAAKRPAGHRDVVENQDVLATMLAQNGQWREAADLLAIIRTARTGTPGDGDRADLAARALQALALARSGNPDAARGVLDAAMPLAEAALAREIEGAGARGGRSTDLTRAIGLGALAASEAGDVPRAFRLAQLYRLGPSDRAVLRARARDRAGDGAALRRVQDLQEARDRALAAFQQAAGSGDNAAARAAKAEADALSAQLAAHDGERHGTLFETVDLAALQARLAPDQALYLVLQTDFATRIFAVSRQHLAIADAALPSARIVGQVKALRDRLDWSAAAGEPFDRRESAALGAALFPREIARVLAGKRRVAVVARGPLARVPFAVLSLPGHGGKLDWAIERHAFSYPVGLATLGSEARARGGAVGEFLGVGAPELPALAAAAGGTARLRGSVNGRRIAALGALGLAEGELKAMAGALHARKATVLTGAGASEQALRAAPLASADVVTFATHGLMAGELENLDEAALVLSPPPAGAPADPANDGLLTTSEIARLSFSARLVVLSACNSASGDREGDDALGGLAHAFLYAGAKGLLVSHWRVRDDAAARLTVATASGMVRGESPAEALRRAQLALMRDPALADAANPAVWAPFVVVGD